MTITINAKGAERKRLVQTIAQWLGCEAKYLGGSVLRLPGGLLHHRSKRQPFL